MSLLATVVTPMAPSEMTFRPPQSDANGVENPTGNDVLCGRGVTTNRHKGNEKFRSLVNLNKELYVTSTKRQKMGISKSIVEAVRGLKPPGRFLEKDIDSGLWFDIGDKKAVEKTSQALRDGAASLRKELSRDLGDPDFLSAVFESENTELKKKEAKQTKPKKAAKKKVKVKSHRRTMSNPVMTTAVRKAMMKGRSSDDTLSSREDGLVARGDHFPPRSPLSPGSEHSAPPVFLRSPGSIPRTQHMYDYSPHRYRPAGERSRPYEPGRSHSFEHSHRPPMSPPSFPSGGQTPSPRSYGHSPTCSSGPHSSSPRHPLLNPRTYPGGPTTLNPGHHTMSPSGYQHTGPLPPRGYAWSPRRTHPGPPYGHPFMSPGGGYHRPQDYRNVMMHHTPPRRGPYEPYGAPHGPAHGTIPGPDIALPVLGHEQYSHHPPMQPRWQRPTQMPEEFSPPPSPSKNPRPHHQNMSSAYPDDEGSCHQRDIEKKRSASPLSMTMNSAEMGVEVKLEVPDARSILSEVKIEVQDGDRDPSPLLAETPPRAGKQNESMSSPSAVPDIGFSDDAISEVDFMALPSMLLRRTGVMSDYPFDEPDSEMDNVSVSPLPFTQHEDYCVDPCSLMTLPENLMDLPISPCGPHDAKY